MKKFYITLAAAALASISLTAQEQLPNAGFEEGWGNCTPWTSNGNTKTQGTTPAPWTIAQVIGINGTGKTAVGEKAEGYESESAVKVYNSPNSLAASQIVPGYVTLGTTWSTATGTSAKNADGGTFGGISFTSRPESITFMYKRTHDTAYDTDASEPATVVAYLWKGTYTQASVPGNIILFGNTTKKDMVNRDRSILGMTTAQGGAVTHTDDAELIAKIDYQITGDTEEWTELTIPFEYFSDATPEMFNVIFSAGDYWSTSPKRGNTLTIDDVRLNYPAPAPVLIDSYAGNLLISMMGNALNPGDDTSYNVNFYEAGDGHCDLLLPNFSLGEEALGDIAVEDVTMTPNTDGQVYYNGHKTDLTLSLMGEPIYADVDCYGLSRGGHLYMDINVNWKQGYDPANPDAEYELVPITVAFSGLNAEDAQLPGLYLVADGAEEYTAANMFACEDGVYTIELTELPENFRIEGPDGMPVFGAADVDTAAEGGIASLTAHLGSKVPFNGNFQLASEKNSFIITFPWDGKATTIAPEISEKVVSGITDAAADTAAPVHYNLQGARVHQPQNGLYIEVRGGRAVKVAL